MTEQIYLRAGLTPVELDQIKHLAQACEQHETLTMKLNWSMLQTRPQDVVNDFLCYQAGQLVGYLALYAFEGTTQAEVSAMTDPTHRRTGVFNRLLSEARQVLAARRIRDFLFICEQASASGKACMTAIGSRYEFSEYKMTLGEPVTPVSSNQFKLRLATANDFSAMAHMDQSCFGVDPQASVQTLKDDSLHDRRRNFVASLGGEVIGKIQVMLGSDEIYIYGFCVLPPYRGQGIGRAILTQTVWQFAQERRQPLSLEVEVANANALRLYEQSGFQITSAYDYHRLPSGEKL